MYWDGFGGNNALVREDYINLYERIFPELVSKYAPETFYWQASPSSGGGFDDPRCDSRGDTHFWEVWHGNKPFTEYRKRKFRFCSEYGFESYPSMKTIRTFCEEKDMNCFSRVMENHQKCKSGNMKILMYLADNYLYPNSFEDLVYASQLMQADAIKYGVEHFRRNRGYTMGSVYWQFNDCWPVASWSSVDSLGRYKALHYAAKKFYSPVAMGLFLEKDMLTVNVANETMNDFKGSVKVYFSNTSFNISKEFDREISVAALSSSDVLTVKTEYENKYGEYMYAELFDENGELKLSGQCTECCQYYAFFTGVATKEEDGELWQTLVDDFGPERKENGKWPEIYFANAFIGNYLRLELLCKAGYDQKLEENIRGYFDYMATRTGTLWEHDAPSASCNHGFASHVLVWLKYLGYVN